MIVLRVTAKTYAHATEDPSKVVRALLHVLPEDLRDKSRVREQRFRGHYGNPIRLLEVLVDDPGEASKTWSWILSNLGELDKRHLRATLEERLDNSGVLYIRLDKQEAFGGTLRILEGDDVIRVSVKFRGSRSRVLAQLARELGR
ncbi:MAG: hypothetical protein LRS43_02385 [Desulfurococcales archaeon]|nr:hypothetical protein [Desulfurococcales archaeon]